MLLAPAATLLRLNDKLLILLTPQGIFLSLLVLARGSSILLLAVLLEKGWLLQLVLTLIMGRGVVSLGARRLALVDRLVLDLLTDVVSLLLGRFSFLRHLRAPGFRCLALGFN